MERIDAANFLSRIGSAAASSLKNWKRAIAVLFFSALFYFIFSFNTNLRWNIQLVSNGSLLRIVDLGTSSLLTQGYLSFGLTLLYIFIAGVTMVAAATNFKRNGVNISSFGALPGFVAAGCSCGVGIAGLVGLAGATAALPFNGDLIKVLGLGFMLYALYDLGDPNTCDVKISYES